MDERERLARRLTFGEAADAYDAVRPGYPAEVVPILIARAGLGSATKVLEIGCETGQLTRDLAMLSELTREITSSGLFEQVETYSERWTKRFDRDQYLALPRTFSPHRQLPEDRRARLCAAIAQLIDGEYDGYVEQPYSTTLCLARTAQ
jgi:hypothetical protein